MQEHFSVRTVVLADAEGQHAMQKLKQFTKEDGLIFRSKRGGPLAENSILVQGLHPTLKKALSPESCFQIRVALGRTFSLQVT
jgi:hypothetical protein